MSRKQSLVDTEVIYSHFLLNGLHKLVLLGKFAYVQVYSSLRIHIRCMLYFKMIPG